MDYTKFIELIESNGKAVVASLMDECKFWSAAEVASCIYKISHELREISKQNQG